MGHLLWYVLDEGYTLKKITTYSKEIYILVYICTSHGWEFAFYSHRFLGKNEFIKTTDIHVHQSQHYVSMHMKYICCTKW